MARPQPFPQDGSQQSPPMPDHVSLRSTLLVPPNSQTTTMRMTFEEPDVGTELVRVVKGTNIPSTTEVRFEPGSSTEMLEGQPSNWCNSPTAGQPLVFSVPVPASPSHPDTVAELQVTRRQAGTTVRIPIRVAHSE